MSTMVRNHKIRKTGLTFWQWLNSYEFMCKREFKQLPQYKQENYRREFEMFQKERSQYNPEDDIRCFCKDDNWE